MGRGDISWDMYNINFIYFTAIKKQILSTFKSRSLVRMVARGCHCVGGNRSVPGQNQRGWAGDELTVGICNEVTKKQKQKTMMNTYIPFYILNNFNK